MKITELFDQINNHKGYSSYNHMRLTKLSLGYAEVETEITEDTLNPQGRVHGGCIFSLMDNAGGYATITYGKLCTTMTASVDFMRPGAGTKLTAKGTVVKDGRQTSSTEVVVVDETGKEVAMAHFRYFKLDTDVNNRLADLVEMIHHNAGEEA